MWVRQGCKALTIANYTMHKGCFKHLQNLFFLLSGTMVALTARRYDQYKDLICQCSVSNDVDSNIAEMVLACSYIRL